MEATSENIHWSAIGVVTGVSDELIVEGHFRRVGEIVQTEAQFLQLKVGAHWLRSQLCRARLAIVGEQILEFVLSEMGLYTIAQPAAERFHRPRR